MKVMPREEDFAWFQRAMRKLGFRELSRPEFQKHMTRLGLKAPRPREGREVGFIYMANFLAVIIWTTWVSGTDRAREEDAGWVLISSADRTLYFAPPTYRTKNFFVNLARKAWLAWWRVKHRPLCSGCSAFMNIVHGKAMKARYWACDMKAAHDDKKRRRLSWDHDLPPRAMKVARAMRRERARYRKRARAEGRDPFAMLFIRRPWEITRPENIIG